MEDCFNEGTCTAKELGSKCDMPLYNGGLCGQVFFKWLIKMNVKFSKHYWCLRLLGKDDENASIGAPSNIQSISLQNQSQNVEVVDNITHEI